MSQQLRFSGVMPANVLPFTSDLAIDEPAYRRHLRWLADTRGVTGIVANGHASEVSSLSREERKRSLAIALDELAGACPVIAGVYSDGTQEAVDLARDARAAGAAGVLVFPPTLFVWGADDPTFPEPRAREMSRQFPNLAGFHAIAGSKLFVHEEHPREVAAQIESFLSA